MENIKIQNMPFSANLRISLKPETQGREAALAILRHLFEIMKKNETGIKKDENPEFLHNYRVALRKMRSVLSLIKDVFPDCFILSLQNDLSSLGQMTGVSRDLDVYISRKKHYFSILPGHLRPGLEIFYKRLEKKREKEFSKLEFFFSLYPEAEISFLLNRFRKLQNKLGAYNDLSTEQKYLEDFLDKIIGGSLDAVKLAAAVGCLIGGVCMEKKNMRSSIFKSLSRFQKSENLARYKKLFRNFSVF